jgi:tRNA dimethylallyltransferase
MDGRDERNEGRVSRAVLIAGPTASGKSALALALAERTGGTVINADSMQVYGDLRVLTARPTEADEGRAPHRLYGHVSIRSAYSVGRWLDDVAAALAEAREGGRAAIVTGGTGLYFKALTEGLSPIPDVAEDVRSAVREREARLGAEALHGELRTRDPASALRIPPSDPQRIVRALGVLEATGRPLSDWQMEPAGPPLVDPATARRIVLWPERDLLRARIDARFDAMLAAGALEEARAVMDMDLDPDLPGYRAHGLRPLMAHLRGEILLDEAAERTKAETRQYAKRQFTWFRHQMPDWDRIDPDAPGVGEQIATRA